MVMNRLRGAVRGIVLALVIGIGIAAVLAGGAGCGGGGKGTSTGDENGGGASSGGADLRLAGGDPLTLDPALASDATSASYVVEIFGGLVTIDRDLKIVPDIAASWDVSPDGKVYTFYLRDNVVFQYSNRLVTADDFKYSLERTANPDTASIVAEAYLGDIVGAKDMIRGRADSIPGVEVVDDFTLRITIDEPKPYFLAKLTYPTAFVVDREQIESNPRNWMRKPHGTGPYRVKSWTPGESIVLEANDRYHLGVPFIKTVEFLLSGGSELTMYENDELDVSGVGVNDVERVTDSSDPLSKDYVTADDLSVSYLGFNTQKPPFDDPKVRQAFGYALDREKIVEVVRKNMLPLAHSIMPPGLPGLGTCVEAFWYFDSSVGTRLELSLIARSPPCKNRRLLRLNHLHCSCFQLGLFGAASDLSSQRDNFHRIQNESHLAVSQNCAPGDPLDLAQAPAERFCDDLLLAEQLVDQ